MKKLKNQTLIHSVLTTILLGLVVYAAYSLWYIFYGTDSGADIHLYTVMTSVALGWFLVVFVGAVAPKAGWVPKLIAFFAGNGFFHGFLWGLNAKINPECNNNENVVIKVYTVVFALSAILLFIAFILKARKKCKILNIILAVIYFAVSCGGVLVLNEENIKALQYKKNLQFDRITADEIALTDEEKAICTDWYKNNLSDGTKYPFSFNVDGEEFDPAEWETSVEAAAEKNSKYQGGKTEYIVLTNKDKGLEVTVEATAFSENATCQWTVYIKNTGTENSGVISDFYALNSSFATGDADLYYSMGSDTAASDFSLIKNKLSFIEKKFSATDGKPTEAFLPYFNISGESYGMLLGIGWTGQWASTISEAKGETSITVKQENFNAYLLPGEEVRSPLVSVGFYKNDNPLKGFNLFRNWITECVYPENVTQNKYTALEVAGPMSTRTSDEIIEILDSRPEEIFERVDCFWMDAGWYEYTEGWYDGVGNWTVDKSRYDNGISELSDYAAQKGIGHVLWYEPERISANTNFYNVGSQNEQWLIYGGENTMWNLANEDAFNYYCEYLCNSMKENGVTIYRQDFNFAPLEYWQRADEEFYGGRTGICENHYITNLYRFLDYLCENIDGLIIDNCASGGKRLDLEMTYRSIPFWRSDYNCAIHHDLFEATQSHTYGISFWLPISGTALNLTSEYSLRSAISPLALMDFFACDTPYFDLFEAQRELMVYNYYPIDFGSFDKDKILSMQYADEQGLSGVAYVYKRADVTDTEYTVKMNGLVPEKAYQIYDYDNPEKVYTLTGEELMNDGLTIPLPDGEKAIILMYNA